MQVLWVLRLKLRYCTKVNESCFTRSFLELVWSEFLPILKWLSFHLVCLLKCRFKRQLSPAPHLYLPTGQPKAVGGAGQLDSLVCFRGPWALKAMTMTLLEKGMLTWEINSKGTAIMWRKRNLSLIYRFRWQITSPSWKDTRVEQALDSGAS